eukprot:gb/GECG01013343.1/.p1 GENE.gb/GECG01013343.1/~~gb/GECG01013343.1/.p1  ORF type:complete len:1055 (+),score=120.03 gb/GECG01013343.1/:1-3165(+)
MEGRRQCLPGNPNGLMTGFQVNRQTDVEMAKESLPKSMRHAVFYSERVIQRINRPVEDGKTIKHTSNSIIGFALLSETHISVVPVRFSHKKEVKHYPIHLIYDIKRHDGGDNFLNPRWNKYAEKLDLLFEPRLQPKSDSNRFETPVTLYLYEPEKDLGRALRRLWRNYQVMSLLDMQLDPTNEPPELQVDHLVDRLEERLHNANDIIEQSEALSELANLCLCYRKAKESILSHAVLDQVFQDLEICLTSFHEYIPPPAAEDGQVRKQQIEDHRMYSQRIRNIMVHIGCILQLLNALMFNSEPIPLSAKNALFASRLRGGLKRLFSYLLHDFCPSYWRDRVPPSNNSRAEVADMTHILKQYLRLETQESRKLRGLETRSQRIAMRYGSKIRCLAMYRNMAFNFSASFLFSEESTSTDTSSVGELELDDETAFEPSFRPARTAFGIKTSSESGGDDDESSVSDEDPLEECERRRFHRTRGRVGRQHGVLHFEVPGLIHREQRTKRSPGRQGETALSESGSSSSSIDDDDEFGRHAKKPAFRYNRDREYQGRSSNARYRARPELLIRHKLKGHVEYFPYDPWNPPSIRRIKASSVRLEGKHTRILKTGRPSRFRDPTRPLLYLYKPDEELRGMYDMIYSNKKLTQREPAHSHLRVREHLDDFLNYYGNSENLEFERLRSFERPVQLYSFGLVRSMKQYQEDIAKFVEEKCGLTDPKEKKRYCQELLQHGKRQGFGTTISRLGTREGDQSTYRSPYTSDKIAVAIRAQTIEPDTTSAEAYQRNNVVTNYDWEEGVGANAVAVLEQLVQLEDENDKRQKHFQEDDLKAAEELGKGVTFRGYEQRVDAPEDRVEWKLVSSLRHAAFSLLLHYEPLTQDLNEEDDHAPTFTCLLGKAPFRIRLSAVCYLITYMSDCLRQCSLDISSEAVDQLQEYYSYATEQHNGDTSSNPESDTESGSGEQQVSNPGDCIKFLRHHIHEPNLIYSFAQTTRLGRLLLEDDMELRKQIPQTLMVQLKIDLDQCEEIIEILPVVLEYMHPIMVRGLDAAQDIVSLVEERHHL